MMNKYLLKSRVALVVTCVQAYAAGALAQPADPSASDEAAAGLEQVIVTAQRRSERLQDVPLTIAAISEEQLQLTGVQEAMSLGQVTPGLVYAQKGSFVQPSIRGVSAQGTGPGLENSIATYFDGVYMADQLANLFELADVSRIEVLKGPQGTLYGRNAAGGAIMIFTEEPSREFSGKTSFSYGSYSDLKGTLYLNGPLSERLTGSFSGLYHSNKGYYKDLLNGGYAGDMETWLVRGKLAFEVNDYVRLLLTGLYSDNSNGSGLAGVPWKGNAVARRINPDVILPRDEWELAMDMLPVQEAKTWLGTFKIEADIGGGTLTALSAYKENRVQIFSDADYSPLVLQEFHLTVPSETFSQEINYASASDGRWSWIAGATYYDDDARYEPLDLFLGGPPFRMFVFGQQKTESAAGYAEATFDVTDRLSFIAGLRYTWEEKTYNASRFLVNRPAEPVYNPINSKSWSSTTPRASIKYDVNDNLDVYFTYSEAFKSGGFNPSTVLPDVVNPEEISSYEVGAKSTFSRGALNTSAFYYDYSNLQVATIVAAVSATRNAAEAEMYGIDLDGNFEITDRFRISGGVSWLHAEYTDYRSAIVNTPIPDGRGGNFANTIDATGNPPLRAPEYSGNLTMEYEIPLQSSAVVTLSANVYASSPFAWEPANRVRQDSYSTVNARASWLSPNGALRVSVWGRNLGNEKYIQSESDANPADGVSYAPPRWIGVTVETNF